MTNDEHDKWLYVLSSGFAYQDIKIRVLKSIMVQAGIMTPEQVDRIMSGATDQNFRVTRHRFIRTLRAMFDGHSPRRGGARMAGRDGGIGKAKSNQGSSSGRKRRSVWWDCLTPNVSDADSLTNQVVYCAIPEDPVTSWRRKSWHRTYSDDGQGQAVPVEQATRWVRIQGHLVRTGSPTCRLTPA